MRTTTTLSLALLLAACSGGDDNPFGTGGSGTTPELDDGGSSSDGGADDTGSSSDGGGSDGGSEDGGADGGSGDTGLVIEGTGYDEGDVAYDLSGTAHSGSFSLHALYGSPVLLIAGHMDDAGMQSMVGWMGGVSGVVSVALVGRDETGTAADTADASTLAATYGIDWVVIDPTGELVSTWAERNPPKTYIIDSEMNIRWTRFGTVGEAQVEDAIDDLDL